MKVLSVLAAMSFLLPLGAFGVNHFLIPHFLTLIQIKLLSIFMAIIPNPKLVNPPRNPKTNSDERWRPTQMLVSFAQGP